jgi:RNA polymerase sigma factor (sigma-70 family)
MDFFEFDDAYVRRLRDGDRETVDHFYGYFRELLYRAALRKLRSHNEAEDAVQDTFARAWSGLNGLREANKLGSFMLGICNRVVLERIRGSKRTEPLGDRALFSIAPDPYEEFRRKQLQVLVRDMVAEFERESPKDAKLLRKLFFDEIEKDELCRKHNITRANLRVLLHRAIKKFRALMKRLPRK